MSGWLILALVLFAGVFGVVGILLYHSRIPELDRSTSRRPPAVSGATWRRQLASAPFARGLHATLAVVGFAGFLLATDRAQRSLGEAIVGLTAVLSLVVSLWLKHLRREEQR